MDADVGGARWYRQGRIVPVFYSQDKNVCSVVTMCPKEFYKEHINTLGPAILSTIER